MQKYISFETYLLNYFFMFSHYYYFFLVSNNRFTKEKRIYIYEHILYIVLLIVYIIVYMIQKNVMYYNVIM